MKVSEILNNISYIEVLNEKELEVDNFVIDSRKVTNNSIFIGINGDNFDGSLFYNKALTLGASVLILEKNNLTVEDINKLNESSKTIIFVENGVDVLKELAIYKRSINNIPLIAVTGSAGKTSTKDILYSALSVKFNAFKTLGNKNNHIGLPLTLLNLKDEEICILEMGMNHIGEISYLTNIAKPDIAIITNVGTAHIGNLGSREKILEAKLEILDGLKDDGLIIVNNDNDLLNSWAKVNKDNHNVITYGLDNTSDYTINDIDTKSESSSFTYDDIPFNVPVPGEHYVYNSIPAIIIGKHFNISLNDLSKGIENLSLTSNRMDIINKNNIRYINDAYNANYDAVIYGIKYLEILKGRKIACLGSMLELGDYTEKLHKLVGEKITKHDIDVIVTVGEYTNLINEEAVKYGFNSENSFHFSSNDDATLFLKDFLIENDNILIKASSSCNFIDIINDLTKI